MYVYVLHKNNQKTFEKGDLVKTIFEKCVEFVKHLIVLGILVGILTTF